MHRAKYSDEIVTLVIDLRRENDERRIGVRTINDGEILPAFVDALKKCCNDDRVKGCDDDETAFSELIVLMCQDGFKLEGMPDSDGQIMVKFDLESGRTESMSETVDGGLAISSELAQHMAKIVQKAIKDVLTANPAKLQAALDQDKPEDFTASLSHLPNDDKSISSNVLALATQAMSRDHWADHYPKIAVRAASLAMSIGAPSQARPFVRRLLATQNPESDRDLIAAVKLLLGNSYAAEKKYQPAIEIYKEILTGSSTGISEGNIAWAHHNLGHALLRLGKLEDGLYEFKKAAAIRAANGEPDEPAKTLATAATTVARLNLRTALTVYSEAIESIKDPNQPGAERLRAHLLFASARIHCLDLQEFKEALDKIEKAEPEFGHALEDAETIASSLMLKAICLDGLHRPDLAEEVRGERHEYLKARPFLQASQLDQALAPDFAGALEDESILNDVVLIQRINDIETAEGAELVDMVESALTSIDCNYNHNRDSHATRAILLQYVADRLEKVGRLTSAIDYHLRAVAEYPASLHHRSRLGVCLYNLGRYEEAAQVGLSIARDNPGNYIGYFLCGVAAYKAADYQLAESMLSEALSKNSSHESSRKILEKAKSERLTLRLSINAMPVPQLLQTFAPTTHADFLRYLTKFAGRIQLNSDAFWKSRANEALVQNPENAARSLLAQDLAASSQAVAIYKESIVTGGRIDLIINVLGVEFILEIKMCGAGYSRNYAEGGFPQLKDYLRERNVTRGYLVVFDARVNQTGDDAIPAQLDLGDGVLAFCAQINIRGIGTK